MLKHLHVTNFKAWRELQITLGAVTGLFGTNSSGKSSILQFLLMLKQTKDATDRGLVLDFGGPNRLVNLGNYQALVHGGDRTAHIDWELEWTLRDKLVISDPERRRKNVRYSGDRLQVQAAVGLKDRSELSAKYLEYRFDDTVFALRPKVGRPSEFELRSEGNHEYSFIRNQGRGWPLPGPVKTHLFPDEARTYYQNADFLSDFAIRYESLMDTIYYLGPLREHPQREYRWAGYSPRDVGPRGERTVEAILAATGQGRQQNLAPHKRRKDFQELIAHWLRELELIDSFSIHEIAPGSNLYHARVRKDRASLQTMLTDVGFGVSQVLPVLVLLYYVPERSIVLLEHPEIHLHPSVQSGLADVMLSVAAHRKLQIVVESHSEHLLRRFQRRVAEAEVHPSDVKLYFVEMSNGAASCEDLSLNEWGEIENWPVDFFGDEMGEIAAINKSALRRRIEASS